MTQQNFWYGPYSVQSQPSSSQSTPQPNWFGYSPAPDDFDDDQTKVDCPAFFTVEEEIEITFINTRHRYVSKCGKWSLTSPWEDGPAMKKGKIDWALQSIDKHSFSIATQGVDIVKIRREWTAKLTEYEESCRK